MSNLLLLDANSLTYRAFFALPTDMATASGQVTNAVFGFTSMLINLLKDHKPDAIAVAFDRPEPTFRHEVVEDYKAGRAEARDILRQQMGLVRQIVDGVFANLESATPKLRQSLAEHEAQVRRNAEVIPLVRDLPLDVDLDKLSMGGWDPDEVRRLFAFLEFRTLWDRLVEALGPQGEALSGPVGAQRFAIELQLASAPGDASAALSRLAARG